MVAENRQSVFGIATGAFIAERDDWSASVTRAASKGYRNLELTAITLKRLESLGPFLEERIAALGAFHRVSIHAPGRAAQASQREVVGVLNGLATGFDLVLHPDVYVQEQSVGRLGARAVFENMDCQKDFGRDVRDLRVVFSTFPDAGFCLDVAHVWTNDPTLGLGHQLIDRFGHLLRQVHVSGIEPDGTHRPTSREDLELYRPLLMRCKRVPWILETELDTEGRAEPLERPTQPMRGERWPEHRPDACPASDAAPIPDRRGRS